MPKGVSQTVSLIICVQHTAHCTPHEIPTASNIRTPGKVTVLPPGTTALPSEYQEPREHKRHSLVACHREMIEVTTEQYAKELFLVQSRDAYKKQNACAISHPLPYSFSLIETRCQKETYTKLTISYTKKTQKPVNPLLSTLYIR